MTLSYASAMTTFLLILGPWGKNLDFGGIFGISKSKLDPNFASHESNPTHISRYLQQNIEKCFDQIYLKHAKMQCFSEVKWMEFGKLQWLVKACDRVLPARAATWGRQSLLPCMPHKIFVALCVSHGISHAVNGMIGCVKIIKNVPI